MRRSLIFLLLLSLIPLLLFTERIDIIIKSLMIGDIEDTLRRFDKVGGNDAAMKQLIDDIRADLEYMKLGRKPELFERFAPSGVKVPLVYITNQGFNVHPINALNLATEALFYRKNWDEFRDIMDWMLRYLERKGDSYFFNFYFAWERASIPWNSSISQGIGAGYYAVAYKKFGDKRYLEAAMGLARSFLIPYEEGGFALKTEYGPFYLEYSNSPDDLVLNGFMLSLKGLVIYNELVKDDVSEKILKDGLETLRRILPYYERGNWSLYSPKHGWADETYHRLHIRLLYFLGKWFNDDFFLQYARRWDSYLGKSELPRAEQEYSFWRSLIDSLDNTSFSGISNPS
jgi:hypothetical protein